MKQISQHEATLISGGEKICLEIDTTGYSDICVNLVKIGLNLLKSPTLDEENMETIFKSLKMSGCFSDANISNFSSKFSLTKNGLERIFKKLQKNEL